MLLLSEKGKCVKSACTGCITRFDLHTVTLLNTLFFTFFFFVKVIKTASIQ